MSTESHHYELNVELMGNKGSGTIDYRSYGREHHISYLVKQQIIEYSSDPTYCGDARYYNPEELFITSVANCQMLWYLHFCAVSEVVVTHNEDRSQGVLSEDNGIMRMRKITIFPTITITKSSSKEKAIDIIDKEHNKCFIANSINVPLTFNSTIRNQKKLVNNNIEYINKNRYESCYFIL